MPEMALVEQKEEDSAVIRYFADDEEGEEEGETAAFIPDEWYVDEKGQTYQLDFYRLEEWEIPETEEWQVRTETFYKVEDPAQIPGELSVTAMDDENKREGRGTLKRNAVKEISGSWADDFQVSLTFYDYGAETYQLGDRLVPGENVLEYLLEEQQLFLEAIGCSPLRYRIRSLSGREISTKKTAFSAGMRWLWEAGFCRITRRSLRGISGIPLSPGPDGRLFTGFCRKCRKRQRQSGKRQNPRKHLPLRRNRRRNLSRKKRQRPASG